MTKFSQEGKSSSPPLAEKQSETPRAKKAGFSKALNLTVAATGFGFALVQLDVTIVNVALPKIAASFSAPVSSQQWVVDAYSVTFSALLLSAGTIGDKLGAKKIYLFGIVAFTVASLACGLAPSATFLITARALQGIGAALMLPNSLTLLSHACESDDALRSRAVGRWTAAGGFAIAAGPIVGGFLVQWLNWRAIFFVNLPLSLAGGFLAWKVLQETAAENAARSLDWAGQGLATLAIGALSFVAIEVKPFGWTHPAIMAGAVAAVMAGWILVKVERCAQNPMLPLDFFHRPGFSPALLYGIVVNFAYYGIVFVLTLYLQQQLHFTAIRAGMAYLPLTATFIAANMLSGWWSARSGPRWPMTVGGLLAAAGFSLLLLAGPESAYLRLLPAFIIIPAGIGLGVPAMTSTLLSAVEKSFSGIASAVLNAGRQAAGGLGVAVFGALVGVAANDISRGIRWSAMVAAIAMIAGAWLAYTFLKKSHTSQK